MGIINEGGSIIKILRVTIYLHCPLVTAQLVVDHISVTGRGKVCRKMGQDNLQFTGLRLD